MLPPQPSAPLSMPSSSKYPSFKLSKGSQKVAQNMSLTQYKGLRDILHGMVLRAEDPAEDPAHRQWCAGQASVNAAYLDARHPRASLFTI